MTYELELAQIGPRLEHLKIETVKGHKDIAYFTLSAEYGVRELAPLILPLVQAGIEYLIVNGTELDNQGIDEGFISGIFGLMFMMGMRNGRNMTENFRVVKEAPYKGECPVADLTYPSLEQALKSILG
ncbi:MAG: hypothetical protein WCV90_01525 [Candidatus Woesearchaeota archaeon]